MIQLPLLIAAAALGGIELNGTAMFCNQDNLSMGGFDPSRNAVVLCEQNLQAKKNSALSVMKHELAHVLQHRLGRGEVGILPDGLLTPLVRELLPQTEVMTVLMRYPSREVNGELEARLASRYVPSELIALGVVATRAFDLKLGQRLLQIQQNPRSTPESFTLKNSY